jgi:hypothetical protein
LAFLAVLFLIFLCTRKRWARSVFVPVTLVLLNLAWLASAIICLSAGKFSFLQGVLFGVAYSFIILVSPIITAAGLLEAVVVVYSVVTVKTSWPTPALRNHTFAYLSAVLCFLFYYKIARSLIAALTAAQGRLPIIPVP